MRWVKAASQSGQPRCSGQYFNTEFRKWLGQLERWIWVCLTIWASKSYGYHGWLSLYHIYIYTHKHIFQSRTVNFGVCRPIFRHTHINDFRICFIFFVPFPAVGEGRRTSTNVRYLGGRWLATFQWFLTELLRVMTWCHRQLGHLGTFCAEVPSGGARVQTCKRICEVSSDFACSKKSSFEKRDFDNGRAKSRIDLVHVDMNHPKPQEVSSGHNMSL
jgi:hypothetical protein